MQDEDENENLQPIFELRIRLFDLDPEASLIEILVPEGRLSDALRDASPEQAADIYHWLEHCVRVELDEVFELLDGRQARPPAGTARWRDG